MAPEKDAVDRVRTQPPSPANSGDMARLHDAYRNRGPRERLGAQEEARQRTERQVSSLRTDPEPERATDTAEKAVKASVGAANAAATDRERPIRGVVMGPRGAEWVD